MAARTIFLIFCYFFFFKNDAASTQSTITKDTGATSRSTDHVNTTTDGVMSLSTAATLSSSTQNSFLSNGTQGNTQLNATSAPNVNKTVPEKTNSDATSAPNDNKTVPEKTNSDATSAPNDNKTVPENTGNKTDSEQHERGTKDKEADHKWVWIVLGLSAVAIIVAGAYWKCYKAQNHPVETMDHGTENASFQRTESNKDGVMLLGVKTGGEENAAAK